MDDPTFFNLGYKLALRKAGRSEAHINFLDAFGQECKSGSETNARLMKLACELASNIYTLAGPVSPYSILVTKCANTEGWNPALDWVGEACLAAFPEPEEKAGAGIPAFAAGLLQGAQRGAPDALLGLAGLSALAGAGLGTLNWKVQRDITEDEDEVELLKERAAQYRALTRRLDEELRARNPDAAAFNQLPVL